MDWLVAAICELGYAAKERLSGWCKRGLRQDLRDHAGADGAATLADGEAHALLHGDRVDQLHHHLHVVARHHHLLLDLDVAGDIRGAEVELRAIALEERRVTAAFFLGQDVHLTLELRVRGDRARLAAHLAALDFFLLGAAQEQADVVARLALVEQLAEHLHAGDDGLLRRTDADDLDFLADLDDAALDATGHHRAAAEIENTSSTGSRNGLSISRFGSGIHVSSAL